MSGRKRYLLQPPSECAKLDLAGRGEPTARHASWDWTSQAERSKRAGKPFCKAQATEVVLSAGEVLYLPSYWFHFIVSLDRSMQCNSRDGQGSAGSADIHECGF